MKIFGGKIDFVLHSIGMSVNVRKGKHYTDLNHDWTGQGWDVSEELNSISFKWIKGHNNHPQNETCDKLAFSASEKKSLFIDEGYEKTLDKLF